MPDIRIAIDCRAATKNTSGVGRYIINLAKGLGRISGLQLMFLVRDDYHPDLLGIYNSKLIQLGSEAQSISYIPRLRWEQQSLHSLLRSNHIDLYHATWNYGVPWRAACPTVLTLHDLLPMEFPSDFGSRSGRAAYVISQYLALIRASHIISVSEFTRSSIRKYARFALNRTSVVLEGIEREFQPKSSLNKQNEYLLYVGGVGERKNLANLFRAYQIAVERYGIKIPLWISGNSERLSVKDRAILNEIPEPILGRIKFLGYIPDGNLPALYQNAAAFVFPSIGEGFGFPPLEAMASGVPVVTTSCGSIPEVVGAAAKYVDGLDPDSIALGISSVLNNETLRGELIDLGVKRARDLSWDNCVSQTIAVYSDVLSKVGKTRIESSAVQ